MSIASARSSLDETTTPMILQSVVQPAMHCGGRSSTRYLSGKELRLSDHSGRQNMVARSITTTPCGVVTPRFNTSLHHLPVDWKTRSHEQQAEARLKEISEQQECYMLQLTFSHAPSWKNLVEFQAPLYRRWRRCHFATGEPCRIHCPRTISRTVEAKARTPIISS